MRDETNDKGDYIMMDELKLNLGTKFMRKLLSKFIEKQIRKQVGYRININLDEFKVNFNNGDTTIKIDAELKMNADEFTKIIKGVEKQIDED